jgi:hypothetical protein
MKLCFLIALVTLSISSFAKVDDVQEILNSKFPGCDRTKAVFEQLDPRTTELFTSNSGATYYEVYGKLPNGQSVELYLLKDYRCQMGSFGGGGCSMSYECRVIRH